MFDTTFIETHTRPRSYRSRLRRGLKLALVAATAWFATPEICGANPIDYGFSGASAVLGGQPVSITGVASVVPEDASVLYANIQLTSPTSQFAGLYTVPFTNNLVPTPPGTFTVGRLVIHYSNDLSLTGVEINDGFGHIEASDSAPTGSAIVVGGALRYTFSPGSSVVINGVRESISGFFDFDPLLDIEYDAEMLLTGPAPYAGSCHLDTNLAGPDVIYAAGCPQGGSFSTGFASPTIYLRLQIPSSASFIRPLTSTPPRPASRSHLAFLYPPPSPPVSPS
jgi:hypothetical protein